jgi:hypothetical protein
MWKTRVHKLAALLAQLPPTIANGGLNMIVQLDGDQIDTSDATLDELGELCVRLNSRINSLRLLRVSTCAMTMTGQGG